MKHAYLLSISLIITFTFQSCKEDKNANPFKETLTITEATASAEDEKKAYITKYNAYIAVWNAVTPRVKRAYSVIDNSINDKTGRPLEEEDTYFIPSLIESRAIVMLKDIVDQEPKIEQLDVLAPNLIASYKELLEPLKELSDYYKLESYKDDDFKKGSELYFKVREPIKKFIASSDILGTQLQEIDAKLSMEALAEYKEKDELLLYNKGMIITSLKQHSAPLYSITYDKYADLDMEAYDLHLKNMITYHTEFKSLATKAERLKRELKINTQDAFTMYYSNIDTYITEARNLKEMIQDSKKYTAMQSDVEQKGIEFVGVSHLKVTAAGEKVITSSNDLNR